MPQAPLNSLLSLLDDSNEAVQTGVAQALLEYRGDATDALLSQGISLPKKQAQLLSQHLHPGRRAVLRSNWSVPQKRLNLIDTEWDTLEGLLRLLSDFLHDGVTMRQSLTDELDQLADQAESSAESPMKLAQHLFGTEKLVGNSLTPFDLRNSDLAWCIQEGKSNPIGLSLIFLLVAHRLELPAFGCNYPGHFLSYIEHDGEPTLIDTFHNGRPTPIKQLIKDHPEISAEARKALSRPCTLADILRRVLANLHFAFAKIDRTQDADLIEELLLTLNPQPL